MLYDEPADVAASRTVLTDLPAGTVPEWVMLLPRGPEIIGRDGRRWMLPNPAALVNEFQSRGTDLVVDWEHGSESQSLAGIRNPAAGWVKELQIREGAVWGRVQWTGEGRADVENGGYRYLSPSFDYSRSDNVIRRLVSVGLVHQPNLNIPALNRTGGDPLTPEDRHVAARMGFSETEFAAFKRNQGGR